MPKSLLNQREKIKHFIVRLLACFIPSKKFRKKFRTYFTKGYIDLIVAEELQHIHNAQTLSRGTNLSLKYPYSIGIVTYNKRFDKYFKPLIASIREKYAGCIIVCINGNHKEKFDSEYRRNMLKFLEDFEDVYPMFFTDFRSLAKLWNNCLINSPTDRMLLLNDDVKIDETFWKDLDTAIIQNHYNSFKINEKWSHVFLNRKEVDDLGWFDERLLGVGYEDTDFEARWLKKYKTYMPQITNITGIDIFDDKEETVINQRKVYGKYSLFNKNFFLKKFKIIKKGQPYKQKIEDCLQYPYEKFYWRNKNEI